MNFLALGFDESFTTFLSRFGYERTTAVQRVVIPAFLAGQSVCAVARRGSGMLEAVLLPLLANPQLAPAVVVAPTQEQQRYQAAWQDFLQQFRSMSQQEIGLLHICTPHTLAAAPTNTAWRCVVTVLPEQYQPSECEAVQAFAAQHGQNSQRVVIAEQMNETVTAFCQQFATGAPCLDVHAQVESLTDAAQQVLPVPAHLKQPLFIEWCDTLSNAEQVLVWVARANFAEQLARKLRVRRIAAASYLKGYPESQRTRLLQTWQQGGYRVLIVCEPTLQPLLVEKMAHLVLFDLPNTPRIYEELVMPVATQCKVWSLVDSGEEARLLDLESNIGRTILRQQLAKFNYGYATEAEDAPNGVLAAPAAAAAPVAPKANPVPRTEPPARPVAKSKQRDNTPIARERVAPPPENRESRVIRQDRKNFVWDPEVPRTWGDRNAARKEPPKTPLDQWELPTAPDIWQEPVHVMIRPAKYPGLGRQPIPTAQAVIAGVAAPTTETIEPLPPSSAKRSPQPNPRAKSPQPPGKGNPNVGKNNNRWQPNKKKKANTAKP